MKTDVPSLLRRAKRGDEEALSALVDRSYQRVRGIVHGKLEASHRHWYRRVLAACSAGDIVHEVFLRVIGGIRRFDGEDEATFANYLGVLVQNTLLDMLRYHGAERRDVRRVALQHDAGEAACAVQPTGDPTPSGAASLREQITAYRDVLTTFAERPRELLRLRLECGAPYADIAEVLAYASADAARKACQSVRAVLLVRLRARGIRS